MNPIGTNDSSSQWANEEDHLKPPLKKVRSFDTGIKEKNLFISKNDEVLKGYL